MNVREAEWLGRQLERISDCLLFPLLNLGSSTGAFRSVVQPHVDRLVFEPLRARGGRVFHADAKRAAGVDLAGDLLDPEFQSQLRRIGARTLLVSNVLEHVVDPAALCRVLSDLAPTGGRILVSGPRTYPYHPDPIDTMFRPTPEEVATLFPGTSVEASALIESGDWREWNAAERGRSLPRTLGRLLLPIYRPRAWLEVARQLPYVFRSISAYALVLKKL